MKVGIIGSGGREHALCVSLEKSEIIEKIYRLLKDDKFTIDGARKEIIKKNYKSESDIINHLRKIKEKLLSLKERL